jgi:long-chain acyl-CoA synthetase
MNRHRMDAITPEAAVTLAGLFRERVRRSPSTIAYRHYDAGSRHWTGTTWQQMAAAVARWQGALAREGLEPGDRVAIMLRNCHEWVAFDQAALALGLVTVPLYPDDRPDNVAYILGDSGARLLLVDSPQVWAVLAGACEGLPDLKRTVSLSGGPADAAARLMPAGDWLATPGKGVDDRDGGPDDLATIVYTSGTTGRPKGVMLSHRNILTNTYASLYQIHVYPDDVFLSFLPLSHAFERTAGYYAPLMAGATVVYARSIQELAEDLISQRPSILIAVPRIFERIYGRLQARLEERPPLARRLFAAAVAVGWSRFEHGQGRGPWRRSHLLWPLLNALVARKVMARLGGQVRIAVSGGAPLAEGVAKLFIGLGLPIIQGYGLTEASPVVSGNQPQDNVPASVGRALQGVEVRIGEQDELLVRGPNVMLGYWNDPAATREAIDEGGWLHTGDKARIEDGRLYITGRLKDIIVLSTGEKVPPADMELAIAMDPLFEQVMIVGETKPYLTALTVVNPDQWGLLAQELEVDPSAAEALRDPKVEQAFLGRLSACLAHFPGFAQIRRVTAILEPWTIDNGLITPTMKVKRSVLLRHFAQAVQEMYEGH